jgi:hypothetical protein
MSAPLFEIRDLAKVYNMGEIDVHALRHVTITLFEREFVVRSGPPVQANRHSSTSSVAWMCRRTARCSIVTPS